MTLEIGAVALQGVSRGQIAILSALLAGGKINIAEKRRNLVLNEAQNINAKASCDCGPSTIVACR